MATALLAAANLGLVALVIALAYKPLGDYMATAFVSPKHLTAERAIYKVVGVNPDGAQSWQAYLRAIIAFTVAGFALAYGFMRLQHLLPYSLGMDAMSPSLAFNTAVSFVANTNWQSYSPEQTTGYVVQMLALTVQMFLSAAVSMGVAAALMRGLAARATGLIGNFWVDVTRCTLRILLPLSIIVAVLLLIGGAVQNFTGFTEVTTIAGQSQTIPGGPAASWEAIKQLGTNGGGFYNANAAHPFSNPTPWTNVIVVLGLLLIPFALTRTYGTVVGDQRAGRILLWAMTAIFVLVYAALTWAEAAGSGTAFEVAGGALEGKEQRIGIVGSTLFGTATSGTTGGAVNSMHGSYTAMGGMTLLLNMMLGEVSPGGSGSGIYAVVVMVIITVFLVALLLGRTPTYLGKRIGVRELKIVSLYIIVLPTLALLGLGLSLGIPAVRADVLDAMSTVSPHGVTELLYAFISTSANNGSSFAGLSADTPWLNTMFGVLMWLGRLLPIALVLALAGSFAKQEPSSFDAVGLPVHRIQFAGLVVAVVVIVALPMYLPYLMAGPFAEGVGR
jgi:K+-transporting ATPase ATPase A chain